MRWANRVDANHGEIVSALEAYGVSVIDTHSMGRGFPDLIIGIGGATGLVEIKNPNTQYGRAGLNENQKRWKQNWLGGAYAVVSDVTGALTFARLLAASGDKLSTAHVEQSGSSPPS